MSRRREQAELEWYAKSNLEKARAQIRFAEDHPFAPGQTAGFTAAIAYLLLKLVERSETT